MAKIDIYGLGNALVDFEFEVEDDTLARLGIEKSLMTLIDEKRERELLEELDGVKHVKACGGSAANTIMTIQQLGAQAFYCGKVAADNMGDFFYQEMIKTGVMSNMTQANRALGVTGKCIAMITPDAERTMNTFLGISAELSPLDIDFAALKQASYLYCEGYVVCAELGKQAILQAAEVAKENNVKIALSLSDINVIRYAKAGLDAVFAIGVDLLFSNQNEALAYAQVDDIKQAAHVLQQQAKLVLISMSERGVLAYDGREFLQVPAYPVQVVDSIGAGDVFAGGVLYGLAQGWSLAVALDIGCFAAGQVITEFGPRLDARRTQLVKQHISHLVQMLN